MKKQLVIWCLLLSWGFVMPQKVKATHSLNKNLPALKNASSDTIYKKGTWTVGLETANNSSFYGRYSTRKYPYTAGTLTYVHRTGLWASVTSYKLFNTESYIDETDLSLGYSFSMGKRATGNVSYSRFIFSKNNPQVKSVVANIASANAALDWNILYTSLTTSYIFGGSNDVFVVLDNSRYVGLNKLWNGKIPVGIDPKISLISGTQQFSETYTITEENKNTNNGNSGNNKGTIGGILDPIIPGNSNNGNNNGNGTTTTTTTTTVKNKFNILNYDFKIPVVVTIANFEIEPAWRYSIPVNKLEGDESKPQSFYSLNLSYTF